MKKVILFLILGIFLVSFVYAQQDGTGPFHEEMIAAGGQEGTPIAGEGIGVRIMAGAYIGEAGQQMQIQQGLNNRQRLMVGGVGVDCNFELLQIQAQNRTKLYAKLANGQNAEIRVMPDTASETALQRLRLRNCSESNNCSIELKEVGLGNQVRVAYELKTQRESKVFGLFRARMNVQAQVNAETGEVIRVNKPWWAFLAVEPEEAEA